MRQRAQISVQAQPATVVDPAAALATELWRLLRAFNKAESAALSEKMKAFTSTRKMPEGASQTDIDEYVKFQEDMATVGEEEIDKLVTGRLAMNNRRVPLLHPSDTDRIINGLLRGQVANKELLAGVSALRPIIDRTITSTLSSLLTYHPEPYQAFWLVTGAIMAETRSGYAPHQIIQLPNARAEIYRKLIGPHDWRKLQDRTISFVTGLRIADIINVASIPDEEAAARVLSQGDEALTMLKRGLARVIREHFATRAREIWGSES